MTVFVTVDGDPGKQMEVDLWTFQQPGRSDESYTKYTDENGIALFEGIDSGIYYLDYNLNVFLKEYGNAYATWGTPKVEITEGITQEVTISLTQNQ